MAMPTPAHSVAETPLSSSPPAVGISTKVLACVLCQQRKVRCNREFPCSNCIKAGVDCVPGSSVLRQRRRRFPERELLDRLRHYENLLQRHNIEFRPMHAGTPPLLERSHTPESSDHRPSEHKTSHMNQENGQLSGPSRAGTGSRHEARNLWCAMNQRPENANDPDDSDAMQREVQEVTVRKAWQQYESSGHLFFGSQKSTADLSGLHPGQIQIFKLWQVYLENVDPLLKVTHTPSLQPRIIDAAGNVSNLDSTFEALMFSIYCIAILSLTEEDCLKSFTLTKQELLSMYQFGCQQALLKCEFLRSSSRECLTALYLYLVSKANAALGRSF